MLNLVKGMHTEWLRCVGSLILYDFFDKKVLQKGAILPKELYNIRDPTLLRHTVSLKVTRVDEIRT